MPDYLLPVIRKLQNKDSDVPQSVDLVKSLKITIEKLRNNSHFYLNKRYGIAEKLTSKLDIVKPKVTTQRICSKLIYRHGLLSGHKNCANFRSLDV